MSQVETERVIVDLKSKSEWIEQFTTRWTKPSTVGYLEKVVYPDTKLREQYEKVFITFANAARQTEETMIKTFADKQVRKTQPVKRIRDL